MYIKGDIDKIIGLRENVDARIQVLLAKVGMTVSNTSKQLAPVDTGSLRRSISLNYNWIMKGVIIVGSPLQYAARREFENNLHPQTKYYMARGRTENQGNITRIVESTLKSNLG